MGFLTVLSRHTDQGLPLVYANANDSCLHWVREGCTFLVLLESKRELFAFPHIILSLVFTLPNNPLFGVVCCLPRFLMNPNPCWV